MHEFKHPNYYKELRKAGNELAQRSAVKEDLASSGSSPARNKLDQAISGASATAPVQRATGPGLRGQAKVLKPQAASSKQQATEIKAASDKLLNLRSLIKFYVSRDEVLG